MPLRPPSPSTRRRLAATACALAVALVVALRQDDFAHRAASAGSGESAAAKAPGSSVAAAGPGASGALLQKEPWHEAVRRAGVDASNFYKNAFVLYAALTDEEKKMLSQPLSELDPEKADALFAKIEPIMELLRQGAQADYCEWGIGPLSFDTRMTHVTKSMELGHLAQWSAAYRFPSDPQGALGDLAAQARLGDHLSDSLIGWLVQSSMESGSNKVVRENAALLDAAGSAQARELVQSSTVGQNLARAFAGEAEVVDSLEKTLVALSPEERARRFQGIISRPDEAAAPGIDRLLADDAARAAEFQYLHRIEQQMTEALQWPDAQYAAWWKGVQDGFPEHPLGPQLTLTFTALRTRYQQAQVDQAMLTAGLTLLQGGPEPLGQFPDPVTGTPFTYEETADGFELQSTFKRNGKSATMRFRTAPPPP